MPDSVKRVIRKHFPGIPVAIETLARWKRDVVDLLYAMRPFDAGEDRVTPYGFKLAGGNSVHYRSMLEGTFEQEEVALIREHLPQVDVFVDVGANIGFHTCLARHAGKFAVAVEPQAVNLRYLCENLLSNSWGDTEVFPLGLSIRPGVAPLFGASSTGASLIQGWAGASSRYRQVIPVTTLDILLGSRFIGKKLFVKIDVEGFEYSVLMGCTDTLTMTPRPTWMVEVCLSEFYPQGRNPDFEATFQLFLDRGYEVRTVNRDRRLLTRDDIARFARTGKSDSTAINYLFSPGKEE